MIDHAVGNLRAMVAAVRMHGPWPMMACAGLLAAAGLVVAEDSPARAQAIPDTAAAQQRGRVLMERYHCGSCHTVPGVAAARGTLAVTLQAYGQRSYIAGRVANRPAMLARWIMAPESVVPGTAMPNMGVSAPDAHDIAAYLGSLR